METTLDPPDSPVIVTTAEVPEFSLVLGGPLFQICRRAHLAGDRLELLHRQVFVLSLIAWFPLLCLSVIERHALGGAIKVPFLHDIEVNARFLIALPVLIGAEFVVHNRVSPLVRRFLERGIVVTKDLPAFKAAVSSAIRARNSVAAEVILLILVYTAGLWMWRSQHALGQPSWYAMPDAKHLNVTFAGYWYAFVSIPIFQFILLRWYLRLGIWFRLLWKISRLNLHLTAAHPDHSGGIGFVGKSSYAFGPILFAQGTLISALIASRVLHEGESLMSFKMDAAGFVIFFVFVILAPLVMFTPAMVYARRKGSSQYGLLASRYVFAFEDKWIHASSADTSKLLGSADIQSMGDLETVCGHVSQMGFVPFGTTDITRLAVATAAPFLPLALTVFSVPQVLKFLVKIIFK